MSRTKSKLDSSLLSRTRKASDMSKKKLNVYPVDADDGHVFTIESWSGDHEGEEWLSIEALSKIKDRSQEDIFTTALKESLPIRCVFGFESLDGHLVRHVFKNVSLSWAKNFTDFNQSLGLYTALPGYEIREGELPYPRLETVRAFPHRVLYLKKGDFEKERYVFRLDGQAWTIIYEGNPTPNLRDCKGLRYISQLIRFPGVEFHPVHLQQELSYIAENVDKSKPVIEKQTGADSRHVIDNKTVENLNRRNSHLDQIINASSTTPDQKIDALKERKQITKYLKESSYKGRSVEFPDEDGRARKAVGNAIQKAIKRLKPGSPLRKHLQESIEPYSWKLCYKPKKNVFWRH